jgi:hypothetical protein
MQINNNKHYAKQDELKAPLTTLYILQEKIK